MVSTGRLDNKLTVLITKEEIVSFISFQDPISSCSISDRNTCIGDINGIPIVITQAFRGWVEKTPSNNLYRLYLYLDDLFISPVYRVHKISEWDEEDWSYDNLKFNLEALDLHHDILVKKEVWNDIYNNPGKDWSDIYCNLLI